MGSPFCCVNIEPYRSRPLDHDDKFSTFITWAKQTLEGSERVVDDSIIPSAEGKPYAVQLVRQVNYGPLESKRYFVPREGQGDQGYLEVTEDDLVNANFQKLNSWKNFKCNIHNKFFEVNLYQKDPINKHHWRANIARPADHIDV